MASVGPLPFDFFAGVREESFFRRAPRANLGHDERTPILFFYIFFFKSLFNNPKFYHNFPPPDSGTFPPQIIFKFLMVFISLMIVFQVLTGILTILSGQFIKEKKYRMFSIVIACINCISFPLGTALGVFTLIVLFRNSVIIRFDKKLNV